MTVAILRSRRKTFALEMGADGIVARVPLRAGRAQIDAFLGKHRRWIETHERKLQEQQEAARTQGYLSADEIRTLTVQARKVIPERVRYYAPLVGVTYGRVTVRSQRSRWGSCSAKGSLNFNCLLMLAPLQVLDSVVVHELCHRKVMDHSKRFYAEVLRVFPEYPRWNRWLKENGPVLMERMEKGRTQKAETGWI